MAELVQFGDTRARSEERDVLPQIVPVLMTQGTDEHSKVTYSTQRAMPADKNKQAGGSSTCVSKKLFNIIIPNH